MEPVSRKEAIKTMTTLNNFLLQNLKYTPNMLNVLQKVRDEIQVNLNFSKNQTLYSYFDKTSRFEKISY